MANIKFSDFTAYATTPVTATSGLVAYEGTTNIQFTPAQLAPFTGIYAANGVIGTARTALLTDILRFRDFTNTNDIFTLNSNGTFTLGLAAATTGTSTITIGDSANTYSHSKNIAIGYSADSSASLAIAIGSDAQSTAGSAVSIGNLSESATTAGVAIGYASAVNVGATYGIAIGGNASTSGANSITLNSNSGAADNTTANTFGVYMTSNTTPDFEVVGGGMSTLNTNLTVKGTDDLIGTTGLLVENNSGNDLFFIKNDGTFALGKAAVSSSDDNVVIGGNATDTASSNSFNVIIGKDTSITGTGNQGCIILGDGSLGTATGAVAVGSQAKAQAVNAIAIGQRAQPTGANSITLDASGSGLTTPSTANAFGVYMSSNTTPDFEVISAGESTLNTRQFKITGQAYTELHTNATNLVISWDDGNVQAVTISGSTPTFAPTYPKAGATYILTIEQGATPVAVDWNSLVKWSGGAPTLSSTTGQIDVITLICYDASTANGLYYGAASLNLA